MNQQGCYGNSGGNKMMVGVALLAIAEITHFAMTGSLWLNYGF